MSAVEHNGHTWALDDRNPPHVIKDGEDNGVSIQGEEALWSEVVRLSDQLAGAVGAGTALYAVLRDGHSLGDEAVHDAMARWEALDPQPHGGGRR